jgi:hypothetical protein
MKTFASRLSRSWPGRLALSMALMLVFSIGYYVWNRYHSASKLRAAVEELNRTDPGWTLAELEAARAPVADADNSALLIDDAAKLLDHNWLDDEFTERFADLRPEQQLNEEQIVSLRWKLDSLRPALTAARRIADKPNGRYPIQFARNPLTTILERQQGSRNISALLRYDAWICAHNGDRTAAATACRAGFHVARAIGDEPITISQLVRSAEAAVACSSVERVLAQGEMALSDLESLQRLVEQEAEHRALEVTMRGERAMMHAVFEALESGETTLDELDGPRKKQPIWDTLRAPFVQAYIRADHPVLLGWLTDAVAAARLPEEEQEAAFAAIEMRIKAEKQRSPVAALLMPASSVSKRRIAVTWPCCAVWPRRWPPSAIAWRSTRGRIRWSV